MFGLNLTRNKKSLFFFFFNFFLFVVDFVIHRNETAMGLLFTFHVIYSNSRDSIAHQNNCYILHWLYHPLHYSFTSEELRYFKLHFYFLCLFIMSHCLLINRLSSYNLPLFSDNDIPMLIKWINLQITLLTLSSQD